jgi:hypothetical protein
MTIIPITFLSLSTYDTYEGTGYMHLDENMVLIKITDEQGNTIPDGPYSYKVTENA